MMYTGVGKDRQGEREREGGGEFADRLAPQLCSAHRGEKGEGTQASSQQHRMWALEEGVGHFVLPPNTHAYSINSFWSSLKTSQSILGSIQIHRDSETRLSFTILQCFLTFYFYFKIIIVD